MPPQAATVAASPPTDWFSQNAPPPKPLTAVKPPSSSSGDWFADNAPSAAATSPQLGESTESLTGRTQATASQFGSPTIEGTVKEILGHLNDAASLGAGRNAGEMWQTAKSKFQALRSHLVGGTGSDPITAITDWIGDQIDQHAENISKYNPKSQLAQRSLATIPLVGSTAASILDDLNNNRYADAALKTGKTAMSAATMTALPELQKNVASTVSKAASKIKPPPAEVASSMAYENTVAPAGLSAADQAALRDDWTRAHKYIGQETAKLPVKSGEGAVMRAAAVTRTAANKLWKTNVEPVIDKFAGESGSTADIADRIRKTPSDIDIASRPGIQKKVDRLASVFDRQMTIAEMNSKVTELNADPAVGKFYDMGPAERAQALQADPTLHAKVSALDGLREKMFDTIADKWGDEGGQAFREARKDYGSLRNVEQSFRDAKVPTPKPLSTRIANSARVTLSAHAATEYLRNPVSTLLDLNNPNKLAAKAVNKAGKAGTPIPPPPSLPSYSRPAGPAAAQALPPMTAEGVKIPAPPSSPVGGLPPAGFPAPQPLPDPYASGKSADAMWGEKATPISTAVTGTGEGRNVIGAGTSMGKPEPSAKGTSSTAIPKPPKGPLFYRSEAAPLARRYGLIPREPSAPGLVSFQDSTTGGSIEMKDGFTEDQLAAKVKAHRDAMAATGPAGKSDLQATKRAAATSRFAHEAAPATGTVKAEMGKLKLFDLVTPRQQTTLETLMRGPRWKSMDAADRGAAIKAVLQGGKADKASDLAF